jgi:ubiquinone/menaquinone biosynthesis C-methylase UbiE
LKIEYKRLVSLIESVDWNEVWKERMKNSIVGKDCVGYWSNSGEAANYKKMIGGMEEDPLAIFKANMNISPSLRVLDIGAGTGRLAIPFANISTHVTAVEPSEQMLEILAEGIRRCEIKNIDCVRKRWEDVDIETDLQAPYDLVLASFSLGFPDIRDSLQKMIAASSKYICIMWFAGETSWENDFRKVMSVLSGKSDHPSMPKSDVLFNVLYQMGIYPNIKVFDFELLQHFSSLDEATDYFARKFNAPPTAQKAGLKEVLPQILKKQNGQWILSNRARNMMLWWEKN